jgi:hypothetical protein
MLHAPPTSSLISSPYESPHYAHYKYIRKLLLDLYQFDTAEYGVHFHQSHIPVYVNGNFVWTALSGELVCGSLLFPATSSTDKHQIRHKKSQKEYKSSGSHHMFIKSHSIFLQLRNRISNGFNKNTAKDAGTDIPGSVPQTSSERPYYNSLSQLSYCYIHFL